MTVLIIVLGQFFYIASAPIFSKTNRAKEYSYLAINLAYILLITLYYSNRIEMTNNTFLLITILVYIPVAYQILNKNKQKKQA
ncbi:hypothetical protein CHH53_03800 [Terribacillus sp. 7520-G]|nr:hypothetical protein CHH53_03800 [Terribacillus sp. 7520-G]